MSAAPILERDWQRTLIDTARTLGWRVAHFRAARTAKGWRTPVAADGAGFPDLVLVRPPRVVFVELKREGGKLRAEQQAWIGDLAGCDGVETYVWRPADWDIAAEVLRGATPCRQMQLEVEAIPSRLRYGELPEGF